MNLRSVLAEAMSKSPVLLGVDFDGTIAAIVERPDQARPDPAAVRALASLAASSTVDVVVISGRALPDLQDRLGHVPGAVLIGEHGNDTGQQHQADARLEDAKSFLSGLGRRFDTTVEIKARSAAFHTRTLDRLNAAKVGPLIREWAVHHSATLLEGKEVFELTVAAKNKGDAIAEMSDRYGAVVYIGDDATDETVFRVLRSHDVGIKVGDGDTAARYRVGDVPEVVELLEVMARDAL